MLPIIPLIGAVTTGLVSVVPLFKKQAPPPAPVAPPPAPATDYTIPILGGAALLGAAVLLRR